MRKYSLLILVFCLLFMAASTKIVKTAIWNSTMDATVIGQNSPTTAWFTTASAGTFVGNLTGNASTATQLAANGLDCASGYAAQGVDAAGNAVGCSKVTVVHGGSAVGCTTGSSTYSTCSVTVTFDGSFADTNYFVSCVGNGANNGRAAIFGISGKTTNSVQVGTVTEGSQSVSYATVECVAFHP